MLELEAPHWQKGLVMMSSVPAGWLDDLKAVGRLELLMKSAAQQGLVSSW